MRITQGAFSFLPDLTDEQIKKQVDYAISKGWAVSIEWTDDPHPRNSYWELWGLPMFDTTDAAAVLFEVDACRNAHPNAYVKINAFDNTRSVESTGTSFIVGRPSIEPGFYLDRQEVDGRQIRYTLRSYAVEGAPAGERYSLD